MAKPTLGTKRLCANCDTKFFDLERNPIVCPKCGTTFVEVKAVAKPEIKAKAAPEKKPVETEEKEETAALDTEDAEFVSLEDADEEASDAKSIPDLDDVDVDLDDDDDDTKDAENNTFLEDDEEDGPNLSDIVGGVKPTADD